MPESRDETGEIAALKYEEAVRQLEALVQDLEGGELPLEASLDAYRRGSLLLRHCRRQLEDAEDRLRVLEDDDLKPLVLDSGKSA